MEVNYALLHLVPADQGPDEFHGPVQKSSEGPKIQFLKNNLGHSIRLMSDEFVMPWRRRCTDDAFFDNNWQEGTKNCN